MYVTRLRLANTRLFQQIELEFQPKMNVLFGENGAGKSTVLDIIRIMLSHITKELNPIRITPSYLDRENDISVGQSFLNAELICTFQDWFMLHTIVLPQKPYSDDSNAQTGQVRNQTYDLLEKNSFTYGKQIDELIETTFPSPVTDSGLSIYFSPHRSVIDTSSKVSRSSKDLAYHGALDKERQSNIRELAQWWFTQQELAKEEPNRRILLETLNRSVGEFLESYTNIHAIRNENSSYPDLFIDKAGQSLHVRSLSDGERSMLVLIVDIARRLALLHPKEENPLQKFGAIVLIDELELHLHPRWQRIICERLTRTFPQCQFIVTTHSPQIIGEVRQAYPDCVTLIEDEKTSKPEWTYGMDTNSILRFNMDTDEQDPEVKENIKNIEQLINDGDFKTAQSEIEQLKKIIGDVPKLTGLLAQIEMMQFLDKDEEEENH